VPVVAPLVVLAPPTLLVLAAPPPLDVDEASVPVLVAPAPPAPPPPVAPGRTTGEQALIVALVPSIAVRTPRTVKELIFTRGVSHAKGAGRKPRPPIFELSRRPPAGRRQGFFWA
jgi:hypothetical protein